MVKTTLAGLRAHKLRLVATALAIVLGVGFVAGTLVFGDTARAALFDQFARAARNVDVSVKPPTSSAQPAKSDQSRSPELPLSTLDKVRAVPGVAAADGRMEEYLPLLDRRGRLVSDSEAPGLTLSVSGDPALRPYDLAAGREPGASGEAALDQATADRTHYRPGDTITVLGTDQAKHTLRLVGLISFGTSKQYADQAVVVLTPGDVTSLAGAIGYSQIVVTAAPGVAQHALANRISAALPGGTRVATGTDYRTSLANDAMGQVTPFLTALLLFAIIACVVSAFVIYNTFNILVAQRTREMALLRCVGASRRQVFGSVLLESAVVGLIGAVLGIGLGMAVAYGLFSGVNALGSPLPDHALVLTATPVVVALLLGIAVTVAAAVVPGFRATRVAPLAALATGTGTTPVRSRRRIPIAAAVLLGGIGTALTVVGSRATDPQRGTLLVLAGGIVNFLAVLVLSPLFVGPLVAALGALPGRLFGVPAKLAAANARRNPGRTAATTAALMIGVGLMSAASVAVATVRATATQQIASHYPVDYILRPTDTGRAGQGIPTAVAQRLREQHGLSLVAEVRMDQATLNGQHSNLGTMNPPPATSLGATEMASGSLADLRPGTAIIFDGEPENRGRHVGDRITIATEGGRSGTFTVAAVVEGRSQTGNVMVGWDDFAALHPASTDDMVMAKAADGVSPADSRALVDKAVADYPAVTVNSIADWRAQITSAVNTLIAVVAALLAFAILIALIGITNTLSLSVFERTRESAMIRALGLTRGQLRATLLVEALLMATVGAIVGVGFGLLYGWATMRVTFAQIVPVITFPVPQLVGYVVLAAAAGVLAAVLPARRAARSSIVTAMAET